MHENLARMLNRNFVIKLFAFENKDEAIKRSVLSPVFVAPPVVHGGAFIKNKGKKPLKSKSAVDLRAVVGTCFLNKKKKFKKQYVINALIN